MAYNKLMFSQNTLIKNSAQLNGKRDMRKKFIKSNRATIINDRIKSHQSGGQVELATYVPVTTDRKKYIDPFSIFGIPELQQYDEPTDELSLSNVSDDILPDTLKENSSDSSSIKDLLKNNNIHAKITSGYRPGAKTKSGHLSNHAKGQAWDIKPVGISFDQLKQELLNNDDVRNYFKQHGYGVLSEVTAAEQNKYGSTGAHFHIGPDSAAVNTWNTWLTKGRNGMKIIKGQFGTELPQLATYKPVSTNQPTVTTPTFPFDETLLLKNRNKNIIQLNDATRVNKPILPELKERLNITKIYTGVSGFYHTMKPILEKVLKEQGLPTNNIIDMIAQLGHETGWGKTVHGNYNLGNIKNFHGNSEAFRASGKVPTSTKYKNYQDLYDFTKDYVTTLSDHRYRNPFTGNFGVKVKTGGYAEDPNYIKLLQGAKKSIFNSLR